MSGNGASSQADSFDVVVVGAGSAGAVVARRLSDRGLRTLLLEAGGSDGNPAIHDPGRSDELWGCPDDWAYRTVAQDHAGDRSIFTPRGRVLGGSSSINGMIYIRGARSDYDGWAAAGNPGWAFADVLPLFKRSEDFDGGASELHGTGGPMRVMSQYRPDDFHAAIVAAGQEAGLPFNADHNGERQDGIGFMHLTIKDGRRHSTAAAFLNGAAPPSLTIRTRAQARRLVLDGHRCVGVEYEHHGEVRVARADGEVVVCAGTIESPKLLMLSGLGPADELRRHGLEVRADLPGVGRNLRDHATCPVIFAAPGPIPEASPGLPEMQTHLFWRSRAGLAAPDVQPLNFARPHYDAWMSGPDDAYTLKAGMVRPQAAGTVTLASADPRDAPLIDPDYLGAEEDLEAMVRAVELCREIGRQPALAPWTASELYPGPEVRTASEVRDYVHRATGTYHHHAGTCRMGVGEDAVVDPELRVRGLAGLRVADASIMPSITTGNTHAPTVMIGERAADLVGAALRG